MGARGVSITKSLISIAEAVTVKKKYRLKAGIVLLSKGEFKLGVEIGSEPYCERFSLDLYLFKFNAWVAVIER